MEETEHINYKRIADTINYISQHFREQPGLEELAEKVHLSPFHFQRLFTEWAGTSPKKFLQYISIGHAKKLLRESHVTLAEAAHDTGLSGTGRLHDLFITIEGMTPAEYRDGGKDLRINYSFAGSPFGKMILASTSRGICYMAFAEDESTSLADLHGQFPRAQFVQGSDSFQQNALAVFHTGRGMVEQVRLHLKGTAFQLKVWEALLKIPMGHFSTYKAIAEKVESPKAARAVGGAVGSNPVAFLIPCHRVIQSNGTLGGYMWGTTRKTAIIGWEASRTHSQED